MKKKLSIGTIILLALAGLCLVWGFYLKGKVNTGADTLKDAIYIENAALDKANEGKTVVLTGKLDVSKYAYDENVGVTLKTIYAYRKSEYLDLRYKEDDKGRKDYYFRWVENHQKDNNLNSSDLFGNAELGDFSLDNSILKTFKKSSYYKDFDSAELNASYWSYVEDPNGHAYLSIAPEQYTAKGPDYLSRASVYDSDYEGLPRVSYSYIPLSNDQSYTIVGVQQDGRIVAIPELLTSVFEGKLSVDEITAKLTKHEKSNAKIPFVLMLIFLAIAAIKIARNSKKPSYSTGASKYAKQAKTDKKNEEDITIDIE